MAVAASVFVALVALTPARSPHAADGKMADDAPLAVAEAGEEAPRIFAEGIVEGAEREIALRFEVPGRITVVHAREGAAVKSGDVLAELESDLAELQLTEAQSRLRIATAERDQVLGGSTGRMLGPEEKIIIEAKMALAEAAVRRESLLVDKTRLRAPIDGIILSALAERGECTGPMDDRDLFLIADRGATRVRAFVEELDGLRVLPGQLALVSVAAHHGQAYRGKVRACSPCFRPKAQRRLKPGERLDVRMREIVIDLDDGRDLLVGLPVEVFIEAGHKSSGEGG